MEIIWFSSNWLVLMKLRNLANSVNCKGKVAFKLQENNGELAFKVSKINEIN